MSFSTVLLLFIAFRIVDWLISYLAPFFIPYLGFFPYKEIAAQYNLPKFLTAFANFDGAHYLLIAKNGYSQYQQAFFPLYPLLIRWLSPLFFNNHLLTGIAISNVFLLFGLFIFSKYLVLVYHSDLSSESEIRSRNKFGMTKNFTNFWTVLFLATFPTSFFFSAVYTEGLFFFLLVGSLYFLKKEKYGLMTIFAFLATLTRFVGVFLIIPIVLSITVSFLRKQESIKMDSHFRGNDDKNRLLITILSPILGLILYSLYLFQTTGDPFFFLNSQWAFGAHRSSNIIFLPQVYYRYLNIFFTARFNFQYFISLFEFITFNFVLIFVILNLIQDLKTSFRGPRRHVGGLQNRFWTPARHAKQGVAGGSQNDRIGLGLFSLVNLIIPTLTGTFSSIPRYALFSLSFFIYLARTKSLLIKIAIAVIFLIFHILMLGFFVQGYFVS